MKKQSKIRNILRSGIFSQSNFTNGLNVCFFLVILAVGLSTISYTYAINQNRSYCNTFNQALVSKNISNISFITSSQAQLLSPVQTCLSNQPSVFLQTSQTQNYFSSINQLHNMAYVYNGTTPVNVFNSQSLTQI